RLAILRPLDCFVATLLATTVPKIVPYRDNFPKQTFVSLTFVIEIYLFKKRGISCQSSQTDG
ncbi:hypothetical protein, partial [Legionella pneumophila]|uniref:hypothetical protein n=1 Tax=Legionella pneumophila TaxID=446 RepID=UPI001E3A80B4